MPSSLVRGLTWTQSWPLSRESKAGHADIESIRVRTRPQKVIHMKYNGDDNDDDDGDE